MGISASARRIAPHFKAHLLDRMMKLGSLIYAPAALSSASTKCGRNRCDLMPARFGSLRMRCCAASAWQSFLTSRGLHGGASSVFAIEEGTLHCVKVVGRHAFV